MASTESASLLQNKIIKFFHKQAVYKNTLYPLFMDGNQLSEGYRATTRRQFNFYH